MMAGTATADSRRGGGGDSRSRAAASSGKSGTAATYASPDKTEASTPPNSPGFDDDRDYGRRGGRRSGGGGGGRPPLVPPPSGAPTPPPQASSPTSELGKIRESPGGGGGGGGCMGVGGGGGGGGGTSKPPASHRSDRPPQTSSRSRKSDHMLRVDRILCRVPSHESNISDLSASLSPNHPRGPPGMTFAQSGNSPHAREDDRAYLTAGTHDAGVLGSHAGAAGGRGAGVGGGTAGRGTGADATGGASRADLASRGSESEGGLLSTLLQDCGVFENVHDLMNAAGLGDGEDYVPPPPPPPPPPHATQRSRSDGDARTATVEGAASSGAHTPTKAKGGGCKAFACYDRPAVWGLAPDSDDGSYTEDSGSDDLRNRSKESAARRGEEGDGSVEYDNVELVLDESALMPSFSKDRSGRNTPGESSLQGSGFAGQGRGLKQVKLSKLGGGRKSPGGGRKSPGILKAKLGRSGSGSGGKGGGGGGGAAGAASRSDFPGTVAGVAVVESRAYDIARFEDEETRPGDAAAGGGWVASMPPLCQPVGTAPTSGMVSAGVRRGTSKAFEESFCQSVDGSQTGKVTPVPLKVDLAMDAAQGVFPTGEGEVEVDSIPLLRGGAEGSSDEKKREKGRSRKLLKGRLSFKPRSRKQKRSKSLGPSRTGGNGGGGGGGGGTTTNFRTPEKASSSTPRPTPRNVQDAKRWKATFDAGSGKTYYYHKDTKEVRWEKPLGYDEATEAKKSGKASGGGGGGGIGEAEPDPEGAGAGDRNEDKADGGDALVPAAGAKDKGSSGKKAKRSLSVGALGRKGGRNKAAEKEAAAVVVEEGAAREAPVAERARGASPVQSGNDHGGGGDVDDVNKLWRATLDASTGKTYYYNKKTKEVSWTKPPGFGDASGGGDGVGEGEGGEEAEKRKKKKGWFKKKGSDDKAAVAATAVAAGAAAAAATAPKDADAMKDAPDGAAAAEGTAEAEAEVVDEYAKYWRDKLDPSSGKTYYFNKKTKVVTWTKPPGYREKEERRAEEEEKATAAEGGAAEGGDVDVGPSGEEEGTAEKRVGKDLAVDPEAEAEGGEEAISPTGVEELDAAAAGSASAGAAEDSARRTPTPTPDVVAAAPAARAAPPSAPPNARAKNSRADAPFDEPDAPFDEPFDEVLSPSPRAASAAAAAPAPPPSPRRARFGGFGNFHRPSAVPQPERVDSLDEGEPHQGTQPVGTEPLYGRVKSLKSIDFDGDGRQRTFASQMTDTTKKAANTGARGGGDERTLGSASLNNSSVAFSEIFAPFGSGSGEGRDGSDGRANGAGRGGSAGNPRPRTPTVDSYGRPLRRPDSAAATGRRGEHLPPLPATPPRSSKRGGGRRDRRGGGDESSSSADGEEESYDDDDELEQWSDDEVSALSGIGSRDWHPEGNKKKKKGRKDDRYDDRREEKRGRREDDRHRKNTRNEKSSSRGKSRKESHPPRGEGAKEWTQQELDSFIARNDWQSVSKYINEMRVSKDQIEERRRRSGDDVQPVRKQPSIREIQERMEHNRSLERESSQPRTRFGARSQMQHDEISQESPMAESESVWRSLSSGESYEDERSSDGEESGEYDRHRRRGGRGSSGGGGRRSRKEMML